MFKKEQIKQMTCTIKWGKIMHRVRNVSFSFLWKLTEAYSPEDRISLSELRNHSEEIRGRGGGGGWWSVVKQNSESRSVMSDSLRPHGLYSPWNSPGHNTGVGSFFLLQGIFQTQG